MKNKELDLDTPAAADDSKEVNSQENIEEAPQNTIEPPVAEADISEGENAESALGQESLNSKPEEQTSAPEAAVDKTKQKDSESDKTKPTDLGPKETESKPKKKKTGTIVLAIIIAMLLIGTGVVFALMSNNGGNNGDESQNLEVGTETEELKEEKKEEKSYNLGNIVLSGNDINDFDLAILKIENDNKNIVYSPLSIKYALAMLNEGTSGSSKEQIEKVIGTYNPKTYTNSANLSLANSLFVNSNHKDAIKEAYKTSLQNKYNAELLFDTFETPDNMNGWIENKTLGLIKNTIPNTNPKQDIFYLINALGIDMEWKQKIGADEGYSVSFKHVVSNIRNIAVAEKNSAGVAATAFKYDFMKELGEDGIRNEVKEAYDRWAEKNKDVCSAEEIAEYAPDLDEYVSTLSSHYGHFSKSTDFEYYDDDNVQLFAKDLKEYDGTTLQYVGILPKNGSLEEYIENVSASEIGELIGKLKPVETESFDEGVVTILSGYIPFFKFDYQPEFKDDLMKMGITDIFDSEKADLGGISDTKGLSIGEAIHKANIDFSNEGIKAGAVTVFGGGLGGASPSCHPFRHDFEVPTKRISLDFSSPFLFLIRDKDSGEIWFTGSVYEPNKD